MDEAVRYLCVARLDGIERYFLWESGDDVPDRVVLDEAGFVLVFPSEHAARQATVSPNESARYELDAIEAWCKSTAEVPDCRQLLNAWNLLGDLPKGETLFARADSRATPVYDKLFWGCNLPAMTPPGEHYVPTWSETELASLKHLLLLGIAEFRGRLR